jgi:hypothetical protein
MDQITTWFVYINSGYCAYKSFYFFFHLCKIRGHEHPALTQLRKNLLGRSVIFGVTAVAILVLELWWLLIVPLLVDLVFAKIYPVEEASEE